MYFTFSTQFCFMAFCVFMTRFFVSSKILILACSSAMIHGTKNVYFQKQMFSSTSWMCYYNNYIITSQEKNLNMCLIVQLRLLSMHSFLNFLNRVRYFFLYYPQLLTEMPNESSLRTIVLQSLRGRLSSLNTYKIALRNLCQV